MNFHYLIACLHWALVVAAALKSEITFLYHSLYLKLRALFQYRGRQSRLVPLRPNLVQEVLFRPSMVMLHWLGPHAPN
jgi:hypothetical protein